MRGRRANSRRAKRRAPESWLFSSLRARDYLPRPTMSPTPLLLGRPISLLELEQVRAPRRPVALCPEARERVAASRRAIDAIAAAGDRAPAVYGVNTGFGALAERRIHEGDVRALQKNLVRSHACGVGPDLGEAEVRAMMVLRAQVIALGYSGVRVEIVDALSAMLNASVSPRIPSQGSVGASGDLAPLAHLALALIGEGEATFEGRRMPAAEALAAAGLAPVELAAKEGLSPHQRHPVHDRGWARSRSATRRASPPRPTSPARSAWRR